ncbi:MAG: hypothetical protein IJ567_01885 [Lachnospiraceae bacterium]|nr:hypothetical protein [Lachnospiraceae bacterium]
MGIPGEDQVLKQLKEDDNSIRFWEFNEILELRIEQIYDDELCANIYIGEFIVTDGQHKLKIEMKGIHGNLKVYVGTHMQGFVVEDCISKGFQNDNRYHLTDFENTDDLSIYCSDVYLSVVM